SSKGQDEELAEETRKFYEEFFDKFERGMDTVVEKQDLYYPVLSERLVRFSREQLMRALDNRITFIQGSEWHQMPENRPSAVDVTLLIRDDQSLLKWLNMRSGRDEIELK